ncbi:ftsH, partial [Symbiodinium microadriaticum]
MRRLWNFVHPGPSPLLMFCLLRFLSPSDQKKKKKVERMARAMVTQFGMCFGQLLLQLQSLLQAEEDPRASQDDASEGSKVVVSGLQRQEALPTPPPPERSEVGSLAIDDGGFMGPDYSEELSSSPGRKIDNAIKEISDDCYLNALNILMTNRACLDRVADELTETETMTGDRLREPGPPVPRCVRRGHGRFRNHALVCACGADRVKRHNRQPRQSLNPEVETPGLLPLLDVHGGRICPSLARLLLGAMLPRATFLAVAASWAEAFTSG